MGDFGIKVTLPGADVDTASDAQLLFSSSWPNVKIFKNLHIQQTIPANPADKTLLFTHNLGFVPAVIPFGGLAGSNSSNNVAEISRQNIVADTTNIYILPGNSVPINLDIRLSVLYLDITTAFTAPVINNGPSSVSIPDADFGFKISKDKHDVASHDLRDFILHTAARSPMVHAVVPGQTDANGSFSYTHTLPYNPIFFAFVEAPQQTGVYVLLNGFSGLVTSGNTISITNSLGGVNLSIVILKDPFSIINDNVINVSL